jgi:hypothetical protein
MYKVKNQSVKNSAGNAGHPAHGKAAVSTMGRNTTDRHFKNPSKGSAVSKMGRSVPGSKTGN